MVVNSMIYATYERYKDSGVDWLGAIPSDWDLQPAFKYIKENKTKNTGLLAYLKIQFSHLVMGKLLLSPKKN